MNFFIALLLGISISIFNLSPASALTIGVPVSKPTIQAGIDAASTGDTVLVQPGRYLETIDFKGKNIVVGSLFLATRDTSYILNTIIDAQQRNTVVAFKSGETEKAELCGFTLTNGHSQANLVGSQGNIGGGIYGINSSPYLHHLIVDGNISEFEGGGMYLQNSNSIIENCVIKNNGGALGGGGLYLYKGNYRIKNNIINNNGGVGGGIFCNQSTVSIYKVVFFNNYISIYLGNSNVDIINCTIFDNNNVGAIKSESAVFNIINTIIWTNYKWSVYSYVDPQWKGSIISVSHSDITLGKDSFAKGPQDSLYWLDGNISKDPLFTDIGKNDLTLQRYSPCIDVGTTFLNFKNRVIIDLKKEDYKGFNPDIGAIESDYSIPNNVSQNIFKNLTLFPNYPNPFNESTLITFFLGRPNLLSLNIYNSKGQLIKRLFEEFYSAGIHNVRLDARNLSSGLYFLKLKSNTETRIIRMVLIK